MKQINSVIKACVILTFVMLMSFCTYAYDDVQLGDCADGSRNVEILFDEAIEDKDLVIALYGGEKLIDAAILEDVSLGSNRLFVRAGSIDECDEVKAYIFDSISKIRPHSEPVTVSVGDADYLLREDSYLMIDDIGIGYIFDNGMFALPSGWISYNKNSGNITNGVQSACVSDKSHNDYSALYRDFDAVSDGCITLEFSGSMFSEDDGIYIGFSDSENDVVCSVSADYGEFVLKGEGKLSTGIPISGDDLVEYAITIFVDIENKRMSACIDGHYTDSISLPENASVSRLAVASTVSGTGYILPKHIRMYTNYAMAERFLVTDDFVGKPLHSMNTVGEISYAEYETISEDDKYSAKIVATANTANEAERSFAAVSGKGVFESYVLLPDGADGAFFAVTSEGKDVVNITSKDGAWYVGNKKMRDFTANVWQTLRIETDLESGNAVIKICGKTVGNVPVSAQFIDGVRIGINPDIDTVMWFDDVLAYNYIDHDDYPSRPVANNDDDYNIGINVCNLWHNGNTKEGWQAVSPFADLEPWLGYYDEGSPELADWEIKIMAEHGIDFQHFCWYQPQHPVNTPIKTTRRAAPAIHDGYMNAKYSDMVKFCIMWENANSMTSNFANFKEYIWNYWKEYYFSDPRYMTFDNKPILTVWTQNDFINFFGSVEKAKQALDFMREDIKTLGFDGLIFLVKSSKNQSELGADAGYFYHYSKEGNSSDYQIDTLEGYKDSPLHAIPTLAIGHNGIGRYDYRVPLISLEEHKQVAEYIKNDYLTSRNTGTWRDNTLLISTWNEYSEGHYICPSGDFGYGYLENIKDVFTNDNSDHTALDVMPTEAQEKRITKLYPNTNQPIRLLRNETEVVEKMPLASWDFSNDANLKEWALSNIVVDGKTEGGRIFHAAESEGNIPPDPQMYKYNVNVSLENNPVLHIRMKTEKLSRIWVFFTTDESPVFGDGVKQLDVPIKVEGEMLDYFIDMSVIDEWKGILKTLRIDPVSHAESFEIELVELLVPKSQDEIVLAEWDFSDKSVADSWGFNKYNKTITVDGVTQTGAVAHGHLNSEGMYDPQLYMYNLSLDISDKPSVHIRMKSQSKTVAQLFYVTEDSATMNEAKSIKFLPVGNGESVDYYLDMSDKDTWCGTLKTLRFDPCVDGTPFEIEYIKIFIPQYKDGRVFVNGKEMKFDFRTIACYDEMEVTANPYRGFFTMLNLFHTWNRYTGKLYVESDYHNLEFTVGSDKVMVDGKEQSLGYKFNLRDGLPVIKIKDFCERLGFDVTVDGIDFYVETGRTLIATEKEDRYSWEFETDGNTEGWYAYDSVVHCVNGKLHIEDPNHFDMHLFPSEVSIDSAVYNKLAVGIYVNPEDVKGLFFQMFFKAGQQSLDEDKSFKYKYDTSVMKDAELYEFEIDLTQNKNWRGIINGLRIDIANAKVECAIDYIRFLP